MKRVSSNHRLPSKDSFSSKNNSMSCAIDKKRVDKNAPLYINQEVEEVPTDHVLQGSNSMDSQASSLKRKRDTAVVVKTGDEPILPPEQQQQQQQTMNDSLIDLPNEIQLTIISFLELDDIAHVLQTCSKFRHLLRNKEADWMWKSHCQSIWPHCDKDQSCFVVSSLEEFGPYDGHSDSASLLNYKALLQLAVDSYPTAVDEALLAPCRWSRSLRRYRARRAPAEMVMVTPNVNGLPAVLFTGLIGTGDRCVRADFPFCNPKTLPNFDADLLDPKGSGPLYRFFHSSANKLRSNRPTRSHYPYAFDQQPHLSFLERLRRCSNNSKTMLLDQEQPLELRPFVMPFVWANRTGTRMQNLTPRLVHYYEVNILPAPSSPPATASRPLTSHRSFDHDDDAPFVLRTRRRNAPECVAVGLSTHEFSLHTRMPGWDVCSYGYHGDDGGVFFGTGHMLKHYGPKFDVGDVVGCGIDYHRDLIFFTLNGQYLGPAWQYLSNTDFYEHSWYPTVGIDTTALVQCNFGTHIAFQFDLVSYIRRYHEPAIRERQKSMRQQQTNNKNNSQI